MSVHYKFKSTLQFDTITFDGLHISVGDLKREIIHQKRLGKLTDFDLQITNAQTKEEYQSDSHLIPKNTTLIISRIPVAQQTKKGWEKQADPSSITVNMPKHDTANVDLFKMQGSEEDKIQAMMLQSTADYDPKTYHRIKGQSQVGEVPASYRCNKCKKGGHWIKNCPYNIGKEHIDLKRNTGIPRSFRDKPEITVEQPETKESIVAKEIPEDLICGICNDLFVDAVMIPCCGSSFCDDCVRTALLESEDNECPDCKEMGCSPGSLIPNRFLRNSVNAFKNETGYSTTLKAAATKQPETVETTEKTQQSTAEDTTNKSTPLEEVKADKQKAGESPKPKETEKNEPVAETTSAEPNHEANKTVKQPEVKTNTQKPLNDDHCSNGQATQNPQPPGIESSPAKAKLSPPQQGSHGDGKTVSTRLDKETDSMKNHSDIPPNANNIKIQNECEIPSIQNLQTTTTNHMNMHSERINKPMENVEPPNRGQRINVYKPIMYHQLPPRGIEMHMQHPMPNYNNGYNEMQAQRPPMDYRMYPNQPHPHMNNLRPNYAHGNQNLPSAQHFPNSNLASIYQGVAAKVGTGVIDDPLEAFNRIMKEKEKQKEERRRSPERRRSRSIDRQPKSRFRSPHYDRRPERDPPSRDKRPRSRENRKEVMPERKHKYSNRGSLSPNEKRIRSVKYRSPSPKVGYRYSANEKHAGKGNFSKMESFEPPPPGFESIPTVQRETESKNSNRYGRSHTPNLNEKGFTRVSKDDSATSASTQSHNRRESRGRSKGAEKRHVSDRRHSTTPKPKIMKSNRDEIADVNIVLNKNEPNPLNDRQAKNSFKFEELQKSESNKYVDLPGERQESVNKEPHHSDRRSESKDELSSREHKKKKKFKTERKKNKKDKKDKRDKSRKNSSPETKTTPTIHNPQSPSSPKHKENKLNQFDDPLLSEPARSDWEIVSSSNIKRNRSDEKVTPSTAEQHGKKFRASENSPTTEFRRFDSVLDLEAYDTDLDGVVGGQSAGDKHKSISSQMSKWESDENNFSLTEKELSGKENAEIDEHSLITSDVLRKAESAIFTKAINAIRPVEFKITIPMESRSQERAVSIKRDGDEGGTSPKHHRSIKERLGSKVVQRNERSPLRVQTSKDKKRSVEPKRIVERRSSRRDRDSRPRSQNRHDPNRNRSNTAVNKRDRERERDRERDRDRWERTHANDVNFDAQKSKKDLSKNDNERGRERERERDRDHGHNFKDKRDHSRGKSSNFDEHHTEKKSSSTLKSNFGPTVASVASKPSRHDNPFRKFERVETLRLPKYSRADSSDSQFNDDDEKQKKRRKDKKLKKRSKCSSTETLNSEKLKDNKKKKPKSTKKKKKSKK